MLTILIALTALGACTAARWYLDRTSRRDEEFLKGRVRLRSLWNEGAAFGLPIRPGALLAAKMGLGGLPLLGCVFLAGCLWMLFLLVRTLESVYLVDAVRAAVTLLFSLLLLYIVFVLPWQIGFKLLSLSFS